MRPKYKLRTELVDVLNFADFEEFLILKNFITQDDIKVEHVVQQIVDLSLTTQASEEKKDAADVDYLASLSIWELAQISEPSTHLKLAQVVIQLQKQTAIDPKNGGLIETQGSFLWKDLPSFGYTGTEAWREYGGGPFKGKRSAFLGTRPPKRMLTTDRSRRSMLWACRNALAAEAAMGKAEYLSSSAHAGDRNRLSLRRPRETHYTSIRPII